MSEPELDGVAQGREHADPVERDRPVPNVVLAGVAALFIWAVGYILWTQRDDAPALGDSRTMATLGGPPPDARIDGAQLYAAHCAACHQAGGTGLAGMFPPLARSEWVTGSPGRLAQIVLHGVSGPLTVAGAAYDGQMPAFKDKLDDARLAALLTHVRGQFGNAAPAVEARHVADARAASAGRPGPWKGGDELANVR